MSRCAGTVSAGGTESAGTKKGKVAEHEGGAGGVQCGKQKRGSVLLRAERDEPGPHQLASKQTHFARPATNRNRSREADAGGNALSLALSLALSAKDQTVSEDWKSKSALGPIRGSGRGAPLSRELVARWEALGPPDKRCSVPRTASNTSRRQVALWWGPPVKPMLQSRWLTCTTICGQRAPAHGQGL